MTNAEWCWPTKALALISEFFETSISCVRKNCNYINNDINESPLGRAQNDTKEERKKSTKPLSEIERETVHYPSECCNN